MRERKKAATRLGISDVATALFAEHGFESVTVAQIAEAADVSVKTVFNHFPTKEDLFYDRADEILRALVDAIVDRASGQTVIEALHRLLADRRVPFAEGWSLGDRDGYERYRRFLGTEEASPALRARRLVIAERWTGTVTATVAGELGLDPADPRATTLGALLVAVLTVRGNVLSEAILARLEPAEVERRVRLVVDEAFGRLGPAYADVDR